MKKHDFNKLATGKIRRDLNIEIHMREERKMVRFQSNMYIIRTKCAARESDVGDITNCSKIV